MHKLSLPLTKLIHENFSVIATFAYSRPILERIVAAKFKGDWKHLEEAVFNVSEQRAFRACMDLAICLRELDDNHSVLTRETISYGRLTAIDGSVSDLSAREATNKIIHAMELKWDFGDPTEPRLICTTTDTKWKWTRAEINILEIGAFCGVLAS